MIKDFKILSQYDQKDFRLVVLSADIAMANWIGCYMSMGRMPPPLGGVVFGMWYRN